MGHRMFMSTECVNHILSILTLSCASEMCALPIPYFLFPPSRLSSYPVFLSAFYPPAFPPHPSPSLSHSLPPSFAFSWAPTIKVSEHRDEKDAFSPCLFQILPPQPLTSCLSLLPAPSCPSVSSAISNCILLPRLLLCFVPCSLFLFIVFSPLCVFTPPPSLLILL